MPRPRRLTIDTIQGFNCSYAQKVAYARAAELQGEATPSTFIRKVLDEHCLRVIGSREWDKIQEAALPANRKANLETFLKNQPANRIASALKACPDGNGNLRDYLGAEMFHYIKSFELMRDSDETELTIRVALHEAVDLLQKIRRQLGKFPSAKALSDTHELLRKLPSPLQEDIQLAVTILSGVASGKKV